MSTSFLATNSKPETLHPYTLHPTPLTLYLHSTPYTLHPTPLTLHLQPTSYTLPISLPSSPGNEMVNTVKTIAEKEGSEVVLVSAQVFGLGFRV